MQISLLNKRPDSVGNNVFFINKNQREYSSYLSKSDIEFVEKQIELEKTIVPIHTNGEYSWMLVYDNKNNLEDFRKLGSDLSSKVNVEKAKTLSLDGSFISAQNILAFTEGFVLASYRFLKYFKAESKNKKTFSITQLDIFHAEVTSESVEKLQHTIKAVFWTRNMVNEPVNFMNATRFAKEIAILGQEAEFKVETLDKKQIEALQMGGLLAVNKGSIDPPTFTICEWKPENASNIKPYILVGKGVMYDTGGLSLKPTRNSMDIMKSDMAGAAAVVGGIYSIALNKLPIWIIALIPATDNRPDGNAYAPGDIIKMYNGLHVEVLNTDAEGRMILADALSYGDKFDPELVIDMATLTGSAHAALGEAAAVVMGNADDKWFHNLIESGSTVHERLVQFPFWDDYKESLKSSVADLKNLGKKEAGAISAGKFLEHFTKSPYIHIDIAGPAFLESNDNYRTIGGSGYGVRLLTEFFKNVSNTQ
ncbi:MAG: leucyl aminopeptidase family protein [Salinivirgaceae bacterium]|nr:leucyl aminopeptidase family protein [Salinivirgaceae bacterium]